MTVTSWKECLIISCFLLFLSVTIMNNITLCKMEHHNIVRFLFLRGLLTILLFLGLGVEDQQKSLSQSFWLVFAELLQREFTDRSQETNVILILTSILRQFLCIYHPTQDSYGSSVLRCTTGRTNQHCPLV